MGYAVRLLGRSWYVRHNQQEITDNYALDGATIYPSQKSAETAAIILTLAHADWMRKVKVVKVREIEIKKVVCLNKEEKRSDLRRYRMKTFPYWVTC